MDHDSPDNCIGQELDVRLVALMMMMQNGVQDKLLHCHLPLTRLEISSPGVRPNKISQCTRMKIVRFWYDDPISLGISVQLLTTIADTQE